MSTTPLALLNPSSVNDDDYHYAIEAFNKALDDFETSISNSELSITEFGDALGIIIIASITFRSLVGDSASNEAGERFTLLISTLDDKYLRYNNDDDDDLNRSNHNLLQD